MSTAVLTVAISVTLIAGLLAFTIVSLYRHRLSTAALSQRSISRSSPWLGRSWRPRTWTHL